MQAAVISTVVSTARQNNRLTFSPAVLSMTPNSPKSVSSIDPHRLHWPVVSPSSPKHYSTENVSPIDYKRYNNYPKSHREELKTPPFRAKCSEVTAEPKIKKPLIKDLARDYLEEKEREKRETPKEQRKETSKSEKKAAKTTSSKTRRSKKHCTIL